MTTRTLTAWVLAALVACGGGRSESSASGGEPGPGGDGEPAEDPEKTVMNLVTREHKIMLELEHAEGPQVAALERELRVLQDSLSVRIAEQPAVLDRVIENVERDIQRASPEAREELSALAERMKTAREQPQLDPGAVRELLERREELHRVAMPRPPRGEPRLPERKGVRPGVEPEAIDPNALEGRPRVEPRAVEPRAIEPVEPRAIEPRPTEPRAVEPTPLETHSVERLPSGPIEPAPHEDE